MKNRFKLLRWLWNRRKASSFQIPKGGAAIVLADRAQYEHLCNGLSDADVWTNGHYAEVLTNHTTQILTN